MSPSQLGAKFSRFADELVRFDAQTGPEEKNRVQARLALGALQQRKCRRVQAGPFRQLLMSEPPLLAESQQDMGEGFGSVQAAILKSVDRRLTQTVVRMDHGRLTSPQCARSPLRRLATP